MCTTTWQEVFKNSHDKEVSLSTWPQNAADSNLITTWDVQIRDLWVCLIWKWCIGGFYVLKIIYMNTGTKVSPLEHCVCVVHFIVSLFSWSWRVYIQVVSKKGKAWFVPSAELREKTSAVFIHVINRTAVSQHCSWKKVYLKVYI